MPKEPSFWLRSSMKDSFSNPAGRFGTLPVFFTAISTILGAILFLRFGFAVGNLGFYGTVGIVIIGHLVTIPTALAIAEIATNQRVEGGGEYFIISRSFGLNIGAAIGLALFLSQAISVAFYILAFGEAFEPVYTWLQQHYILTIPLVLFKQIIAGCAMSLLALLILTKGAAFGMKALYIVVAVLFVSFTMFFLGTGTPQTGAGSILTARIDNGESFFLIFAICFPAFTGMTAGVGLSGDLKNPKRSIPLGTISATIVGMIIYILIAYKLSISASPEDLATDQFVMSKVALWGPIIPIGLACATVSSALGSIMVAPRTLQAIANDQIFPSRQVNSFLSQGKGYSNEPFNASLITIVIAFMIILLGNVNFVAEIITMFFMVTYGSLCAISFLQHWSADPAYRPAFKSRWYISLFGAVMCIWLMFRINTNYAIAALVSMTILYIAISSYRKGKDGMVAIFQGAIFQMSRTLRIYLQKANIREAETDKTTVWRPSVISVSADSFERLTSFDLLRWISHRYGFGTYIHQIDGYYSKKTYLQSKEVEKRLLNLVEDNSNVFLDTIISPSFTAAIAQAIQLPGISGQDNNMVLFEFAKKEPENLDHIVENLPLVKAGGFDVAILGTSTRYFGKKSTIDIWIKPTDFENANLMILLGYIIMGHPEWSNSKITIYSVFPHDDIHEQRERMYRLISEGRLPISLNNVQVIEQQEDIQVRDLICERSRDTSLTIVGFRGESVKNSGIDLFKGYEQMGCLLFINASARKAIS